MESVKDYLKRVADAVKRHPKHKPFDEQGRFLPDPQPVAPPVGYQPEESMFDRVRAMVRREMSQLAQNQDMESFEEADDFDVPDDRVEYLSPYELIMEQAFPDARTTNPDPDQGGVPPEDNAGSSPPEPRPSPKEGAGDGGAQPPGERSASQKPEKVK